MSRRRTERLALAVAGAALLFGGTQLVAQLAGVLLLLASTIGDKP